MVKTEFIILNIYYGSHVEQDQCHLLLCDDFHWHGRLSSAIATQEHWVTSIVLNTAKKNVCATVEVNAYIPQHYPLCMLNAQPTQDFLLDLL